MICAFLRGCFLRQRFVLSSLFGQKNWWWVWKDHMVWLTETGRSQDESCHRWSGYTWKSDKDGVLSFTNETRSMATSTTTTQMNTTTAASRETDTTFKTGLKGLGLNWPTSQVLMDQGILRLKDLAAFGSDELDGWMKALPRKFPTPESVYTKDDRLFIPFTVLKKMTALLAWTKFQYACDHNECAIVTFTSEVMEEWMQQINDIPAAKEHSDESLPLEPMKILLDWQSWEEWIQVRAQSMRNLKTGVRIDYIMRLHDVVEPGMREPTQYECIDYCFIFTIILDGVEQKKENRRLFDLFRSALKVASAEPFMKGLIQKKNFRGA